MLIGIDCALKLHTHQLTFKKHRYSKIPSMFVSDTSEILCMHVLNVSKGKNKYIIF